MNFAQCCLAAIALFDNGEWLPDRETAIVLTQDLQEMGLQEALPNDPKTFRNTDLGREVNVDLQMVFMGLWELWDGLWVLEECGLLEEGEFDALNDLIEQKKYRELRTRVQRAYRDYYEADRLH